jgi:hypothetical protein
MSPCRPNLCCAALLLCAGLFVAEPHAQAQESSLLDPMLAALGGRAAIERLQSLSVEADCTGPGGEFRTRVESARPGAVYFRQAAGDQVTEIWSTPERTWTVDAAGAARDLDDGVRAFVRGHEFHLLLFEIESRFSNFRTDEPGAEEGRPCDRILMEDEGDQPAAICIDSANALPLVLELEPAGAEGALQIFFGDWERIEGLSYFRSFTLLEGTEREFTYRYRELIPNGAGVRFDDP